ncbi:MAG TPA: putative leader peptide [Streptosporangiaceae bacterium]
MSSWTAQLLTKRRAVDFCRVATAQCRRAPAGRMRAAC